jgi:hypothetical protein
MKVLDSIATVASKMRGAYLKFRLSFNDRLVGLCEAIIKLLNNAADDIDFQSDRIESEVFKMQAKEIEWLTPTATTQSSSPMSRVPTADHPTT